MPSAIVLRAHGPAEALRLEPIDLPPPAAGELRLRQTAIGVNFHDVYVRCGTYRTLALPGVPGIEATAVVEAVGAGVDQWRPGDRVVYVTARYGAYATHRNLPASLAWRLPDNIDDALAAAMTVRTLTVEVLTTCVRQAARGEQVLIHAAAGGVGRLLAQAANRHGAVVIGTVGSAEKAELARASGCHHVIDYRQQDFVEHVLALTDGRGVDAVYDSVGHDTVAGSLRCLARCGHLVIFGQASGPCPPIEVPTLAARSLTVSRPILFDYLEDRERASRLFDRAFHALGSGAIATPTITALPLAQAGEAHRRLEARHAGTAWVLMP
ncbi:MAG: quinone oxidoreductase [Lautropia sp.]